MHTNFFLLYWERKIVFWLGNYLIIALAHLKWTFSPLWSSCWTKKVMSLRCLGFLFDSQRRRESGPGVGKTNSQQHFVWIQLAKKKTELANSKLKSLILVLTLMPNTWCSGKKGAICDDAMAKPLTPASSRCRCLPSDERKKTLTRFLARVLGGSRYKIWMSLGCKYSYSSF